MPKEIYCAKCGKQLTLLRQVARGRIINSVLPHTCGEINRKLLDEISSIPDPVLEKDNEFVQKLNELKSILEIQDKRSPEHIRKEITTYSSAPEQIQSRFNLGPKTKPDGAREGEPLPDLEEE